MILRVRNWERFQHYKDRNPPWIKFHTETLNDYDLMQLPEAAQAQLFKLWILAARTDNRIPDDRKWVSKAIHAKGKLHLDVLIEHGFLELSEDADETGDAEWSSRYVPEDVRKQILDRDQHACRWCGSVENIEIDHIVPTSKGGDSDPDNLQALCRKCNRTKRTRTRSAEQDATQLRSISPASRASARSREERRGIDREETPPNPPADIGGVWAVYANYHPAAVLTPTRKQLIQRRLRDHPQAQLVAAIHGNHRDPHCNGENPGGKQYHDLALILRDADHIERYADLGQRSNGTPSPEEMERRIRLVDEARGYA